MAKNRYNVKNRFALNIFDRFIQNTPSNIYMKASALLQRKPSDTTPRTTAATTVYEQLRADILSGLLEPSHKLRIEFLCERYDTGGSPVREALNRLSAEGFVEREDQRGFFVAPVSLAQLRELVTIRCWLEERALREAIAHRSEEWEENIVIAFHRLSRRSRFISAGSLQFNPDWEHYHHAFHHALLSNCGSRILLRYCETLRDQTDRYRLIAASSIYPQRKDRDEHQAIMEAVLDGHAGQAVKLLIRHYRRTLSIVQDYFTGQ